eukprot:gb/GEZJ01008314.1/.p2 GENE.gb/GEZJ01008314.1/~~gb/GEZJ01008314.1/.p2  ORF type:complete len:115 (+),score=15.74 gb/GEZJ01008314.1/:970-1314(+)
MALVISFESSGGDLEGTFFPNRELLVERRKACFFCTPKITVCRKVKSEISGAGHRESLNRIDDWRIKQVFHPISQHFAKENDELFAKLQTVEHQPGSIRMSVVADSTGEDWRRN